MDTQLFVNKQPGGMFTVINRQFISGSIFWCNSAVAAASDTAGFGRNPEAPVATIDYAFGLCTASKGDVVFLGPGHTENISDATSFLADKIGVRVIGLGDGSLTPTFTLDTAAGATLGISVANVTLSHLRVLSNFTNGVTAGVTLGAAADGFALDDIVFNETANTEEYLIGISVAADCDDGLIQGCRYNGIAGGTTSSIITLAGGSDRTVIQGNYFHGDCSGSIIDGLTAASSDIHISHNVGINIDAAAGLGFDLHDTSTGFYNDNRVTNLKDTVEGFTGNGMAYAENYCSNALNVQGILKPVADA